MRVRVCKAFPYSLDGNTSSQANVGDVFEDERRVRWALELGEGVEVREGNSAEADGEKAAGEKAAGPSKDKALDRAPKNKGAR